MLLTLFEDLFQITKFMSDQLQSPSLELSSTMDLADTVIATLSDKRAEEAWREIWDRATDLCTKAGVSQSETGTASSTSTGVCCQLSADLKLYMSI